MEGNYQTYESNYNALVSQAMETGTVWLFILVEKDIVEMKSSINS